MKRRTGFIDMSGKVVAGATVLREAESVRGGARWHCRLACDCESTVDGSELRMLERKGRVLRCMKHRIHGSVTKAERISHAERYRRAKARDDAQRAEKRQGEKICHLCCGLSWQVKGPRCRACKLPYAAEAPVKLDVTSRKALVWL